MLGPLFWFILTFSKKKIWKIFLAQFWPNPYQKPSLFSLKKWKMMKIFEFFKMLHMVRKWPLSGSEVFSGLETLHFHPTTPPHIFSKNFFKTDFDHLRSYFCLYTLEKAWKHVIFEGHTSNCLDLTMSSQTVSLRI